MDQLSQQERDILDFEAGTFGGAGAKEAGITARFGLTATTYYQQLNALCQRLLQVSHLLRFRVMAPCTAGTASRGGTRTARSGSSAGGRHPPT